MDNIGRVYRVSWYVNHTVPNVKDTVTSRVEHFFVSQVDADIFADKVLDAAVFIGLTYFDKPLVAVIPVALYDEVRDAANTNNKRDGICNPTIKKSSL